MSYSVKTKNGTELPITNLKGKNYLMVAYRLLWFREDHPDWSLETEFLSINDNESVAKCTVRNESGRVIATAHKREDRKGFQDHSEKAETGAIGRALALCGYGTQFTEDLDEASRIVDAPVATIKVPNVHGKTESAPATISQSEILAFKKIAEEKQWQPADVSAYVKSNFQKNKVSELSREEFQQLVTYVRGDQ